MLARFLRVSSTVPAKLPPPAFSAATAASSVPPPPHTFATVVGVYANALSPLETAAVAFLGFYSVFNTYVFVIAICYRPSGAQPAGPTARDREHFEQAASLQQRYWRDKLSAASVTRGPSRQREKPLL